MSDDIQDSVVVGRLTIDSVDVDWIDISEAKDQFPVKTRSRFDPVVRLTGWNLTFEETNRMLEEGAVFDVVLRR